MIATFLFGLIHGFGFSYILKEVGLGDNLFSSLLFFNLGVEAGQLAIRVFLIPLILCLCKRYPGLKWAQMASVGTALMGTFWLVERFSSVL